MFIRNFGCRASGTKILSYKIYCLAFLIEFLLSLHLSLLHIFRLSFPINLKTVRNLKNWLNMFKSIGKIINSNAENVQSIYFLMIINCFVSSYRWQNAKFFSYDFRIYRFEYGKKLVSIKNSWISLFCCSIFFHKNQILHLKRKKKYMKKKWGVSGAKATEKLTHLHHSINGWYYF